MKKIYMLVIAMFGFVAVNAQSNVQKPELKAQQPAYRHNVKQVNSAEKVLPLWESDFSDPSEWSMTTSDDCPNVVWQIGQIDASGDFPTASIESTTADNGWAVVDSDSYNGPCGQAENARLTMADPVDLTAYDHVVVEFETWYRAFNDDQGFLVVSRDGVTWPELTFPFDADTDPDVYQIYAQQEDLTDNPTLRSVNISESAGGEATVYVRFNYVGEWGYTWFIDDFKIVEQPANDMRLEYSVVSTDADAFYEYGRVPEGQMPAMMDFQGQVLNFGFDEQTNVTLDAVFIDAGTNEVVNETMTEASMATSTSMSFDMEAATAGFGTGIFTGTFTLVSDQEIDGDDFGNNVDSREFAVTEDMYSIDGIGVYANAIVGELGPGSYSIDNDPNFPYQGGKMMNYYDIVNDTYAAGLEILLGANTVAGAEIIGFIADTLDVSEDNLDDIYGLTDSYIVTDADIAAGMIILDFSPNEPILANGYYFGIDVVVSDEGEQFRVLEDNTVPQPGDATVFFLDDAVGSQGNALAIRLITGENDVSVNELDLDNVSLSNSPNPASNETVISYNLTSAQAVTLTVLDITGKVVMTLNQGNQAAGSHNINLDVTELASGVYTYTLTVGANQVTNRMIIE